MVYSNNRKPVSSFGILFFKFLSQFVIICSKKILMDALMFLCFVSAGRLKIPSDYCNIRFDLTSPVAMVLPTTCGLGICSIALVSYLCSLHNEFLSSYCNITGSDIK